MVLIGDAAGWNDPIIGQGLSITYRDVRIVSEILRGTDDWSRVDFAPYAEERRERMRRLRFSAQIQSTTFNEFGDAARERRKRVAERQAANPMLLLAVLATMIGPDSRARGGVRRERARAVVRVARFTAEAQRTQRSGVG